MRHVMVTLLAAILVACGPGSSPTPAAETGTLEVLAVAGPICPVETDPPDPDCEPRPVAGARILISPGDGREIIVAEGMTDAGGRATFELPAGDYIVSGAEVEGLMGLPEPTRASVTAAGSASVSLAYDTGIR
jgi:hypothetical protein